MEDGAKLLAKWIGYAWDGLRDIRIGDHGYPQWTTTGTRNFQGGKQDLRDLAKQIGQAEHTSLLSRIKELEEALANAAEHFEAIARKAEHWRAVVERNELAEERYVGIRNHARYRAQVAREALAGRGE